MITNSTFLPLEYGIFKIAYHKFESESCLSVVYGDIQSKVPIVRIHSSCLFGESLHGLDCDCRQQLDATLELVGRHGSGVVIYQFAEGRGVGLEEKIRALEIQRSKGVDTVDAFRLMGLSPDLRDYSIPVQALKDLNINTTVIFASQNPRKMQALQDAGYTIQEVRPPVVTLTPFNTPELLTKKNKLGYFIDNL